MSEHVWEVIIFFALSFVFLAIVPRRIAAWLDRNLTDEERARMAEDEDDDDWSWR